MCRLIALGIIATGVLIVGAIVLIFKFVPAPWSWVLVFGVPMALMLVMWFGIKYAIKAFALGMLGTKSRVLRDASAVLISAAPAQKPAPKSNLNDTDDAPAPERSDDRHYHLLEVTITPKIGQSQMAHWDIDDLRIVDFNAPKITISDPREADDGDDAAYTIERVEVLDSSGYAEPEDSKLQGEQTLRLLIAIQPGSSTRLKFRYYFEDFGDLKIG